MQSRCNDGLSEKYESTIKFHNYVIIHFTEYSKTAGNDIGVVIFQLLTLSPGRCFGKCQKYLHRLKNEKCNLVVFGHVKHPSTEHAPHPRQSAGNFYIFFLS